MQQVHRGLKEDVHSSGRSDNQLCHTEEFHEIHSGCEKDRHSLVKMDLSAVSDWPVGGSNVLKGIWSAGNENIKKKKAATDMR